MKSILFFLLLSFGMQAQQFTIADKTITYKDKQVQTIEIILSPKEDQVRDKLESWLDDNYDIDLDGKKLLFFDTDKMTAKGIVVPEISPNKIDFIVMTSEAADDKAVLNVFATYGYDNYIDKNNHPSEYYAIKRIMKGFISDYLPNYYYDKIEDTREKISDIKETKEELIEKINKNEKKIMELKEENVELSEKIDEKEDMIVNNKQKLSDQKDKYKKVQKDVSNLKKNK